MTETQVTDKTGQNLFLHFINHRFMTSRGFRVLREGYGGESSGGEVRGSTLCVCYAFTCVKEVVSCIETHSKR